MDWSWLHIAHYQARWLVEKFIKCLWQKRNLETHSQNEIWLLQSVPTIRRIFRSDPYETSEKDLIMFTDFEVTPLSVLNSLGWKICLYLDEFFFYHVLSLRLFFTARHGSSTFVCMEKILNRSFIICIDYN